MEQDPEVSVVVPTRGRAGYLEVTLASVAPQVRQAGAALLVVSDGPDPNVAAAAARHGAAYAELERPRGANAARNHALRLTASELLVLIDDDVEAPPGWLADLLAGVARAPEADVYGGPIEARLEGGGPRACGRESPPITTLDLGPHDRWAPYVWSANMALRRRAWERVGPFDETIFVRGDEEEWLRRLARAGGRVRYVAAAGLVHRRAPEDATLTRLSRAAYVQGRAARRFDAHQGTVPPLGRELRVLAGCAWHVVRRRCALGVVMGAHSAGRLREAWGAGR